MKLCHKTSTPPDAAWETFGRFCEYDLFPRLGEPAYDLASETALGLGSRLATVVVFTSVVDLAAAELLRP